MKLFMVDDAEDIANGFGAVRQQGHPNFILRHLLLNILSEVRGNDVVDLFLHKAVQDGFSGAPFFFFVAVVEPFHLTGVIIVNKEETTPSEMAGNGRGQRRFLT